MFKTCVNRWVKKKLKLIVILWQKVKLVIDNFSSKCLKFK